MKVLITGGAGFIGSHLSQLLLDDGDEVFCLDDLSTGSLENVAQFEGNPRYHLVVDSVLHPAIVNELVNKVDVVYHLADADGVKTIVEQPVRTLRGNLGGTEGRTCRTKVASDQPPVAVMNPTPQQVKEGNDWADLHRHVKEVLARLH